MTSHHELEGKAATRGCTPDGQNFVVPTTVDMLRTLTTPSFWGFAECVTLSVLLFQLITIAFISYLPRFYYLSSFALWRLSYNVGLGILLHCQSRSQLITKFIDSLSPDAKTLLAWAVTKPVPGPYSWSKFPTSFNAWVAFRALATCILANDGLAFVIAALTCFTPLSESSVLTIALTFPLSLVLVVLFFWAKSSAHAVVGDYAWFWGDFFFTTDTTFVSHGIFAIFPHPMYTIGYAAYYAAALFCRSYSLLLISLTAHVSQLVFLYVVEEPHIHATYGSPTPNNEQSSEDPMDNPALRLFEQAAPHPIVHSALIVSSCILLSLLWFRPPSTWIVLPIALLARIAHWCFISALLLRPTQCDTHWVTMLRSFGTSHSRIFSSWQHALLISTTLNHALFVAVSLTLPGIPFGSVFSARPWALTLSGTLFIILGVVAARSARCAAGSFAFYYGDFFVQPVNPTPNYTGVFTYVNHPDACLFYLIYYGVAVLFRSPILAFFAAFCQLLHVCFVIAIETPHMAYEYKDLRAASPAVLAACNFLHSDRALTAVNDACREIWTAAITLGVNTAISTRKQSTIRFERLHADCSKLISTSCTNVVRKLHDALRKLHHATGEMTCARLIHQFKQYGIDIKHVDMSQKLVN